MEYGIVIDSGCDLNNTLTEKINPFTVPLTMRINGNEYRDDEKLSIDHVLAEMSKSDKAPSSACPSPADYLNHMEKCEKGAFIVTISAALSGSYQSAVLAVNMLKEKCFDKFFHVFDTKSASCGETLVMMKIDQLLKEGLSPEPIVKSVNHYISNLKTVFLLDNLDTLSKAGRLSPTMAMIAKVLNIKLVCAGNDEGKIELLHKKRGEKKAFAQLIESVGDLSLGSDRGERVLAISHCNALDKAKKLRAAIKERYNFKDIVIMHTRGIGTIYADTGGLIVSF